uniref:pseudouridine 5'-phosphatase n=1 Tax=Strigamia maritima TaxID=126957 RepID=T1J953_STRMM
MKRLSLALVLYCRRKMTNVVLSHVIFDLDGLLLDTESLYTIATQNVLDEFNATFTWDVKVKMMGKTALDAAKVLVDELHLPITPEKFNELAERQYRIIFPTSKLMPGAEKLVRHLHKHKIPIAIATGSNNENYVWKTEGHKELFSLFHHAVLTSSDKEVKQGKPAPDAFLVCASRFSEKPSNDEVLVFEDALNGVEAGLAAGMKVIMVPDPRVDKSTIPANVTVLKSLEEFQPQQFGLPSYEDK